MRSFYFADRDLRDRVILTIAMCAIVLFLIGPWFEPPAKQCDFLLVLGSIPRRDRLFQASVIHGLCHSLSWKCWRHVTSPTPPPNDMSSRHMSACPQNVGNIGPTFGKKMSAHPAKQHVDKTSSKILPTCRLILLDIKKKSKASQKLAPQWYDLI